jgi:vacuolar-type H+-ATPase subunit C/Vma6
MAPSWADLNARARGLATHLLPPDVLAELAHAPDLAALARRLAELGIEAADPSPGGLDLAVRRTAAAAAGVLGRWIGDRSGLLRIVLEDEDRRSVRAMVRGAAAGTPAAARLAGLLPTATLPERLLDELAGSVRPRDIAGLLTVWRHPFGPALLEPLASDHPDLFAAEHALNRVFTSRAVAGAAEGGAGLRAYVADLVDLANVQIALSVVADGVEQPPGELFLSGGERLDRDRFSAAAAAEDVAGAVALLAPAFPEPRASLLRRHANEPARLDRALLAERIGALGREARQDPLGPAPLLRYFLRLRAQVIALRAAIWGAALAAPPALRAARLPQRA